MRIVDLFAGLEGWSGSARARHSVVSTDVDPAFGTDVTADVLEPDLADRLLERLGGRPDLVLASPPCEAFSVLTIGRNWTKPDDVPPHEPKTDEARFARRLVERTRELIAATSRPPAARGPASRARASSSPRTWRPTGKRGGGTAGGT
jgi:hypothetical protein